MYQGIFVCASIFDCDYNLLLVGILRMCSMMKKPNNKLAWLFREASQ